MRVMRLTHGKLAGSFSAAGVKPEPSCRNDSKEEKAALGGKQRKEGKVLGLAISQRWRAAGSLCG